MRFGNEARTGSCAPSVTVDLQGSRHINQALILQAELAEMQAFETRVMPRVRRQSNPRHTWKNRLWPAGQRKAAQETQQINSLQLVAYLSP